MLTLKYSNISNLILNFTILVIIFANKLFI